MPAGFALCSLASFEPQSRGAVHCHLIAAHSRVQNVASAGMIAYVHKYLAKGEPTIQVHRPEIE